MGIAGLPGGWRQGTVATPNFQRTMQTDLNAGAQRGSGQARLGRRVGGFTLIELLVVIAIIAILAGMLLPVLGKAKAKGQGIQCMDNFRQLTLAWLMYTHENRDRLLFASAKDAATERATWVTGTMDFDPNNSSNWSVEQDIKKSPLWPYCGNTAGIFKCPSDKSMIRPAFGPLKGQRVPRVRSISMSLWFGGFGGELNLGSGAASPPWRLYFSLSDLVEPGHSQTCLFWDQREDSINLGNFLINMTGYPDSPQQTRFRQDYPGSYHNRAGGLSFADGHAELHRWVDPRTTPRLKPDSSWLFDLGTVLSSNNRDIIWLQERATRRIR